MYYGVVLTRLAQLGATLVLALAVVVPGFGIPHPVHAAIIQVTNGNDTGDGSLRAAIATAAPGDTITFAEGIDTITLTSGELSINEDLIIDGSTAGVTIQRDPDAAQFRIFAISGAGTDVTFERLTIRNGRALDSSSRVGGNGGGITLTGGSTLTIIESTLINNQAGDGSDGSTIGSVGGNGGGIFQGGGALTIVESTLSNNQAGNGGTGGSAFGGRGGNGGGIYVISGILTVIRSTLSDNQAGNGGTSNTIGGRGGDGGGIYVSSGALTIAASTLDTNRTGDGGSGDNAAGGPGGDGGGIFLRSGTLVLNNSTLSANQTGEGNDSSLSTDGDGGGIYNFDGAVTVTNSTLSDNQANDNGIGGGIYNQGSILLANTIVAGSVPNDVEEVLTVDTEGNNIISDTSLSPSSIPTLLVNTDPLLGPLQDNGGPTFTHAPESVSPAIDAGRNAVAFPSLATDQRGFKRIANGTIDIGAVEVGGGDIAYTITTSPTSINENPTSDSRTAVVRVSRSGTAAASSSVNVISSGTARQDDDYFITLITDGTSITNGRLTFVPGTTEATFIVTARSDAVTEPDEDIILTLTNPTAPETAMISTAQVVITINDESGDNPDNDESGDNPDNDESGDNPDNDESGDNPDNPGSPGNTPTDNPLVYLPFIARP